ncbi:hypothetical protein [Dyella silvatica]|uniref:hypothetical protein n=1 Tax=Dyella silvatica TaxID=2992128 RepID=UPI002257F416|nr:hypothetical protein [Dyella silvatica]
MTISRLVLPGTASRHAGWLVTLMGTIALGATAGAQAWQLQQPELQISPPSAQHPLASKPSLKRQPPNEQRRQKTLKTVLAPGAKNPLSKRRFDDAELAREQRYRMNQQDLLQRYRNAAAPPVVPSLPPAVNASSSRGQ